MIAILIKRYGAALFVLLAATGAASQQRETISFESRQKGKPVQVTAEIHWPAKAGPVPALVIHHRSGGATDAREGRYAREMAAMGVAGVVIDSFKPRGVRSTIQDQSAVVTADFNLDALRILTALAGNSRIDRTRIGITGFSKGGVSSLMAAHERIIAGASIPAGLRYALHVPFYPACFAHYYKPKTTGAPIYMLIGGADSYVGVEPCTTYASALQAAGARLEVKIYPNAAHGFDSTGAPWFDPMGENTSQCVFTEQPDGSFLSRQGFKIGVGADGLPIRNQAAISACLTKGVSGGPNAAARTQSMEDLKSYVRRHLLGG